MEGAEASAGRAAWREMFTCRDQFALQEALLKEGEWAGVQSASPISTAEEGRPPRAAFPECDPVAEQESDLDSMAGQGPLYVCTDYGSVVSSRHGYQRHLKGHQSITLG